jgi:hypothetical protein
MRAAQKKHFKAVPAGYALKTMIDALKIPAM